MPLTGICDFMDGGIDGSASGRELLQLQGSKDKLCQIGAGSLTPHYRHSEQELRRRSATQSSLSVIKTFLKSSCIYQDVPF